MQTINSGEKEEEEKGRDYFDFPAVAVFKRRRHITGALPAGPRLPPGSERAEPGRAAPESPPESPPGRPRERPGAW